MPAILTHRWSQVKRKLGRVFQPSLLYPRSPLMFDKRKVILVFVLGGPGSGKGTQSELLVKEFGFCHFSAGDLLRAEQNREGSKDGELIRTCIREGIIVPMEVTIRLLEVAMNSTLKEGRQGDGWSDGHGRFLIDGFPRKMDQAEAWENGVCNSALVVYYVTSEEVMLSRLMKRGETSGREDDNTESIKKRFRTYERDTMPVIEYFKKKGKVAEINASGTVDKVHEATREEVSKLFASAAAN